MKELSINKDKELIRKLRENDIDAFNQLFYAYSSRLYHFAYGYLKSREEAEEMVQEIFTTIWDRRYEIKEDYQFRSYLFSIAFNYIKKYFRSKALVNKYIDFSITKSIVSEETIDEVNYTSLKIRVDQLVDQMPEKRRDVFIKSRFEGKTAKEISDEMNISQSTVENHLNLALKYLRAHLKSENLVGILFFYLFLQ